ncbi:MAG: CSLREA domain-containing protein [Actinobacteria bacterium]|nr:CSLREA domain-containing protein [Actinomycetota bacterium]
MLPALAAAQAFTVNSTGDGAKTAAGATCEAGSPGVCTLRAAIEAVNADTEKDAINFDASVFNGEAGSAITPGSLLPEVSAGHPVAIDGGVCATSSGSEPCVTLNSFAGGAGISVRAEESVVEHLALNVGGSVGIRALGSTSAKPAVEILDNVISFPGTGAAIELLGAVGGTGNLVAGNQIQIAFGFGVGIAVRNGPNRIFGNAIEGHGCCGVGVKFEEVPPGSEAVSGNQVGGDTPASENVISGFQAGAIWLNLGTNTHNEVRRNRGSNGEQFIRFGSGTNGGIQPPAIATALQSSATGTAETGAVVRLFGKATESSGELHSFLGETVAVAGSWKVSFASVPAGTFVTATQTLNGGTSQLAEAATVAAEPSPGGGGSDGGGGTSGGSQSGGGQPSTPPPAPVPPPKAKITAGPPAKSAATTAKFRFTSTVAGSRFQCRLDGAKFAGCRSPKAYKHLKPGKHVFRVRAVDPAGVTGAAAKRSFTVS